MNTVRVALPALCIGLVIVAAPAPVDAQSVLPLSVEGYAGVGVPTGDFDDDSRASVVGVRPLGFADPGFGLGATVTYHLAPMIGLRAGYTYQRFGVSDDDPEFGDDVDLTDSGFVLGLELSPMLAPGLNLLLHADAILHQFKISGEGVSESATSDRSLGYDVGAGIAFPVGPRVSFVPRVRYRKYDIEFDSIDGGEGAIGSVNYFAAGLGLRIRL